MISLLERVASAPKVRPETPREASLKMAELALHVERVWGGAIHIPDSMVREMMLSDGAPEGKTDHFVLSWIIALMPELYESDADRVVAIREDNYGGLTVVLSPYFRTKIYYHLTMQLPAVFGRLEEDARWISNS